MTAHELARELLKRPDIPVVINGWSSDAGFTFEVTEVSESCEYGFSGAKDDAATPRDKLGWELPRPAISLNYNARWSAGD